MLKTIVEKKYLKLNECAADIKTQRDKICELRKERTLLDGIYSKIETQMNTKSRELLELIDFNENEHTRLTELISQMSIIILTKF